MGLFSKKTNSGAEIIVKPEVIAGLQEELKNQGKEVARVEIGGFGWGGPIYDIALDEQKESDVIFNIDGLKFAAEPDIAEILKTVEVIKEDGRFTIRKSDCGCECN